MAKAVKNKEVNKPAKISAKLTSKAIPKKGVAKSNNLPKVVKPVETKKVEVIKQNNATLPKVKTKEASKIQKVVLAKDSKPKLVGNEKVKQVTMSYGGKDVKVDLYSKFDFKGFDKTTIMKWYKLEHLGRRLDEKAALYLKMAKGWSYHAPFAGHDGIQLALGQVFRASKDFLFPYYRDFLTSLSAGLTPEEIILNGLSKETDVAGGGRHMSNHFAKPSVNVQNVSSCTGNHSLHAAGLGRAIKKYNGDEVVFYSGGESACAEGYFFEAISAADFDKSPVIFVIQSNKFGISVPLEEVTTNQNVSDNFRGFSNLKILNCDGLDPFDSYRVLQEAIKYAKSGKGPAMVHAICDRIGSHSNSDNQENYRTEEVRSSMFRRDPLLQFRYHVLNSKLATLKQLETIEEDNKLEIFAAADKAEAAPTANGASWPDFLYPEPFVKISDNTESVIDPNAPQLTYLEGINYALKQEFRRNPNTFMWGEDIGKGGVFNVVKGMPQEFTKNRVFNAPIAEDMIVGTANGFSRYRDDIRLVIEGAEFADYFWPAMEQYIELAHEYWRTKGQNSPNVTLRLASGGYIQGGLYHSQNLEATLSTVPGVRIVQPAFADDAIGLMRNCVRSKGPTMFLEPKYLYNFKHAMGPTPDDNFIIPFGKAKRRREGSDITIVSYGTGVHLSMFAAEEVAKENNISVEIIDLRSLIPWDKEMVLEAVKKTNRVIVVHEDRVTSGFGGEIASTITEHAFSYLDAPILRVGSKDVHVGFAKAYEEAILLNVKDVKAAIIKTVNY
jgi:2-oxoisovalerate dehydrogenase E1 component